MKDNIEQTNLFNAWKNKNNISETARSLKIDRSTVRKYFNKFDNGYKPFTSDMIIDSNLSTIKQYLSFIDKESYSYVLGFYLGDGHISKMKRTFRLRIFQDVRYKNLIKDQILAIQKLLPNNKVNIRTGKDNCTTICVYSNLIPILFPQHGPGMKHTRKIKLQDWQKEIIEEYPKPFIKGLIISDGCRYEKISPILKKVYIRYEFTNISQDIKDIFQWACSLIGVSTRVSNYKNIAVCKIKDNQIMESFIGKKS